MIPFGECVLKSLKLSTTAFSDFASWKDKAYTRNCLHKTATYELILLCWSKKCITAIHDHGDQNCWVYVLEGTLSEREKKELFELLVAEMLTTPDGQRLLRAFAPDPEVQQSSEVARGGAGEGEPGSGEAVGEPAKLASGAERKRGGST